MQRTDILARPRRSRKRRRHQPAIEDPHASRLDGGLPPLTSVPCSCPIPHAQLDAYARQGKEKKTLRENQKMIDISDSGICQRRSRLCSHQLGSSDLRSIGEPRIEIAIVMPDLFLHVRVLNGNCRSAGASGSLPSNRINGKKAITGLHT